MVEYAHDAKNTASIALAKAFAICEDADVKMSIQYAKEGVDLPDGSPEIAAQALKATSHALASCPRGLHVALGAAEKCVRDYLIWRTQLRTDLGDRTAFVLRLKQAVGNENFDSNSYSHFMHSH
eukprot:5495547-Heterocapsa_arctica.AAC.1